MMPKAKSNFVSIFGLLEVGAVLICAASLAAFLAKSWWVFELACHFRPHLAVVLAAFSALWILLKRRRLALTCATFALINCLFVGSLLLPAKNVAPASGSRLQLVSLNVHTPNQRADLVLKFLRDSDADVVLLMEVNNRWMDELLPLKTIYPHCVAAPRKDNFGIALFSKLPLAETNIIELGEAEVPSVTTQIILDGRKIFLIGTHPLPPGSAEYARMRNDQLAKIRELVKQQTLPTVVIGDLNMTPWSPYFSDLLKGTGLKNSSQGLGVFNSWPAGLQWVGIPIDHCLVSPEFFVAYKQVGGRVGSDHLPVMVNLQIARTESMRP